MTKKMIIVNLITFTRLVGAIFLIPIYNMYGGVTVGIVTLFCYITDWIDGYLSRRWHTSTFFGAVFDSVTDKLLSIINFIILLLITPYAYIPLIIEILIFILQLYKFQNNLNIKSSIVGKIKMWFLTICVVITYLVSDIANLSILPLKYQNYIINIPDSLLYLIILLPAIIMEILTLITYFRELYFQKDKVVIKKKTKKISKIKLDKKEYIKYLKKVWLNPEFYELHKNDSNLNDLRKLSKENR